MYNILYTKYIAFCRFMFETGKTICQRCKKIKSLKIYPPKPCPKILCRFCFPSTLFILNIFKYFYSKNVRRGGGGGCWLRNCL